MEGRNIVRRYVEANGSAAGRSRGGPGFAGAKTSRPAFAGRLSTRCTKTAKNEDRTGLRVCLSLEDSTGSGFARALSRPATPLMGLASLSEVVPANRSAGIGFALPLRRQPPKWPRPWGLPCSPEARGCRRRPRTASPRVGVPFRVLPGPACRRPLGRGASLEFLPLQRMQMREPTYPGFASSRFGCGCRVSHPLAALRLPRPSDRLRPVTLMGFSPSKLLPPDGAVAPLGALCPLVVTCTRRTWPKPRCGRWQTRLQGLALRRSPSRSHGD